LVPCRRATCSDEYRDGEYRDGVRRRSIATSTSSGSAAAAFLLRHPRRFVPLTDARIAGASDERAEFSAPIVLVNLSAADSIRDAAASGPE
jgi:hypothetical protein